MREPCILRILPLFSPITHLTTEHPSSSKLPPPFTKTLPPILAPHSTPPKVQRDQKHAQYINPQIPRFAFTDSHFHAFTHSQNKAKRNFHITTPHCSVNKGLQTNKAFCPVPLNFKSPSNNSTSSGSTNQALPFKYSSS